MSVNWLTGFLDVPAADFERASSFWAEASGWALSPRRGPDGRFLTLVPQDGDACWRLQAVDAGPGGVHLDLHVDDERSAADTAVELGARRVWSEPGLQVLQSPGGFGLCLSAEPGGPHHPPARVWDGPQGRSVSRMDQLCLDVPSSLHETELEFWQSLLSAATSPSAHYPEFHVIASAAHRAHRPHPLLRLLVQRRTEHADDDRVTGHLDIACRNRDVETARHRDLGAELVRHTPGWSVLRDPAGVVYCLTDRDPGEVLR